MDEDILKAINSRRRPQVPARDASLLPASDPRPSSLTPQPSPASLGNPLERMEAELAAMPEIDRRSNIRMEKPLMQRLERICSDEGVTLETWLEEAFAIAEQDPTLMSQVIQGAKTRIARRKRAGILKQNLARVKNSFGDI